MWGRLGLHGQSAVWSAMAARTHSWIAGGPGRPDPAPAREPGAGVAGL